MQGYFFVSEVYSELYYFDLEWNNAYSYVSKGFMNEIIEIGAVKLNERLEIVDTFKQLVKPKITKKLSGRCKNLTNITNEELKENGISFNDAVANFAQWSRGEGNVFCRGAIRIFMFLRQIIRYCLAMST